MLALRAYSSRRQTDEDHSRVNNLAVAGSQPVRGSVQDVNAIEERQQVAVESGPFKQ